MEKNKIQFELRPITLLSTDIILNLEYDEPFPEMRFCFSENASMSFSFVKTNSVQSELALINSMFEILESQQASEMTGKTILALMYRINDSTRWELGGYGSSTSDKFMDVFGNGDIVTRIELESILEAKYC